MRFARLLIVVLLLPGVLPAQDTALEHAARAGHQALREGAYTTAVYFLTGVVTAEPKHPSAWKDLCSAYLALDRLDSAIDACRKQIDAHPETKRVCGALGEALWKKGDRDEAISAFRQQIEQAPMDVNAYVRLGSSYCELGRYADAIPLLEKAVAMAPNYNPGQVSLADAHLGLGHIDRGLAILDKLPHEPLTPDELNRAADSLASHKVALDRARQYAESAVAAIATELQRGVEDPIATHTLRLVASLAAYWDTLQRVRFQLGHPTDADKLFAAASAIPAGHLSADKAAAEFYVMQAQKPAVATAQFIRGDERLRPFTDAVRDAVPPAAFPQEIPAKIPRRVTLTCPGHGGDCSIELLSASAALYAEMNAIPPNTRFATDAPAMPGGLRGPRAVRASNVNHPVPTYKIEPEYSEEARKNGLEGVVVLQADVDPEGLPRNIEVVRPLGMGLDEKAIEAVGQWKFRPGTKDGEAATLPVTIEVNFRLMKNRRGQ